MEVEVTRVSPGYYIDDIGGEYFYLSGIYPLLATKLISKDPVFHTPEFIADVLDELRRALRGRYCVELMD